jgi:hypothetical protein
VCCVFLVQEIFCMRGVSPTIPMAAGGAGCRVLEARIVQVTSTADQVMEVQP